MNRIIIIALLLLATGCARPAVKLAARSTPPPLPAFSPPAAASLPAPYRFELMWSNYPATGVSNLIQCAVPAADFANLMLTGSTNRASVTQTDPLRHYRVLAISGSDTSAPSNVVKYPGDIVRHFFAQVPDGNTITLGTTTNTPPGDSGFFRVNYNEWKDYTP